MFITDIRKRLNYFITHQFFKNFAILQVGNIMGNVVQAVVGIIFARILEPEFYGIYALAFSLAGIMSIFLSIGAQDAVLTILGSAYAREDKEVVHEAFAFLAKVTFITGTVAFCSAFFVPILTQLLYHNYHIGIYAGIIIIASVVSTTFYSFSLIILQIVGRIKQMTILGLIDQLLRTLLALIFVLLGFKVLGIAIGHLLGATIAGITAAIFWKHAKDNFSLIPSIKDVISHVFKVSLRKYIGFSFWVALDRNLANLYNILPIFLTGIYVIPAKITYFKLAFGYLNLALSFLGPISTLLNVEFPKMQVHGHEKLARNFIRISLYAFALSIGITAAVTVISPLVFRILYGTKYLPSVPFIVGLFAYGSILGLGIGLGSMLRALNRVIFSIKLHLITLAIGIPLGLFFIKMWGIWGTVIIVTLWYVSVILIAFFYILYVLHKHDLAIQK